MTAPGPALRALAEVEYRPFWLDRLDSSEPAPALVGEELGELAIVGGGFTGLWTAIQAKEDDPARDVLLFEAESVGHGGSGRNGGFAEASLTHGLANGLERFPDELERLEALGRENLAALEAALERHAIDAGFARSGALVVATRPHEVEDLAASAAMHRAHGYDVELLDAAGARERIRSPSFLGGLLQRSDTALVDPGRLVLGLRETALRLGVRLYERTPVTEVREAGSGVLLRTPYGRVRAARCVLGTNAFPPLLSAIRRYVVPVWDYVLVTEPLGPAQQAAVGWAGGEGLADSGNRFHYSRLTDDGRILWGGYEAVYGFGNAVGPERERDPRVFALLSRTFHQTFPQLEGIRFTHAWGGAIDTCSRFSVMFGTACAGRVAYAVGYTGLGVGASRFGARVALDLVDGLDTERTRLRLVRTRPLPFPPEPLRWAGITLTRRALARADETGRRGPWLSFLDRLGLGFDS